MKVTKTVTCTVLHASGASKTLTKYGFERPSNGPNWTTALLSDSHHIPKIALHFAIDSALCGVRGQWHTDLDSLTILSDFMIVVRCTYAVRRLFKPFAIEARVAYCWHIH